MIIIEIILIKAIFIIVKLYMIGINGYQTVGQTRSSYLRLRTSYWIFNFHQAKATDYKDKSSIPAVIAFAI